MRGDRPILILATSQTLVWAGLFYLFPATLLRWETSFGWSKTSLTFAFTLAVLGSALASPLAGKLIDRGFGPRLMGGSTAIGGLAVIGLSQVDNIWQFYVVWGIVGLAMAGSLYDACFALVTHARGADARRGIVLITLVAGFAGTVSFPLVHVLSEAFGWRVAVFWIGAGVLVLVAPLQWIGARGVAGDGVVTDKATIRPETRVHQRPEFWLLGIGLAMLSLMHGAVLNHLLPLLSERAIPLEFAVLVASLIGPMQVVGRLVMVSLQSRFVATQFMLAAYFTMIAAVVALLFAERSQALVLLFVVLYGSAWGTVSILRPLIAREILGAQNFGAKSGALALLFLMASAAAAYVGAVLWAIGGYALMLVVLIVLALLGSGLYVAALRQARQSSGKS